MADFGAALAGPVKTQPNSQPNHSPPLIILGGGEDRYGQKALEDECANLAGTTEGSRNHQLNVAAFKLASLVEAGRLRREETIAALQAAARACGLGESEIGPTIKSAFRGSAAKVGARVVPDLPEIAPAFTIDLDGDVRSGNGHDSAAAGTSALPEQDDEDAPATATLEQIEEGFWDSRAYLRLVYDASIAAMASPWAVLACCVARALAMVPPSATLPPIIGGKGSLNWFAAISAKSGGGKGAAMAVAEQLMPQDVLVRGIGSGEGMIEAYQRCGPNKKDPPPPVTSVLFSIEEIDSLGAMGGRSGQTTMAILRQGFSGEKLGYSYRGRQDEAVGKHTYRMTVVASVQPERAGVLFEDAGGGTPQRFMWFPGRDKRITATPPRWPRDGQGRDRVLPWLSDHDLIGVHGNIDVPAMAIQTIREARARSMSGDDEALDSHALFCREKFAYALALLDGRTDAIGDEDWRLSGVAAAVSDWCRAKAQQGYERGRRRQSRERGALRAHENDEQNIVATAMSQKRIARIVGLMVKHLAERGPGTDAEVVHRLAHRDRASGPTALQAAAAGGLMVKRGDKWELP